MKQFIYFTYASVSMLVLLAAFAPNVPDIQEGAFAALWLMMVCNYGLISFILWRSTAPGANTAEVFRKAGVDPVPSNAHLFCFFLLLLFIVLNGWFITAFAFISMEVSSIIIYKALCYFARLAEEEERVTFPLHAASDSIKASDAA